MRWRKNYVAYVSKRELNARERVSLCACERKCVFGRENKILRQTLRGGVFVRVELKRDIEK